MNLFRSKIIFILCCLILKEIQKIDSTVYSIRFYLHGDRRNQTCLFSKVVLEIDEKGNSKQISGCVTGKLNYFNVITVLKEIFPPILTISQTRLLSPWIDSQEVLILLTTLVSTRRILFYLISKIMKKLLLLNLPIVLPKIIGIPIIEGLIDDEVRVHSMTTYHHISQE